MVKKSLSIVIISLILSVCQISAAYAGSWQRDGMVWHYYDDSGNMLSNTWITDKGNRYYLKNDGSIATGWLFEGGRWYFLDPSPGEKRGQMLTGWQWIDGRCYFLSEGDAKHPVGAMYSNEQTPEGYWVSSNGAWVDESGREVVQEGKGYITTRLSGESIGGGSLGGGSSGGGSSGGGSGGRNGTVLPVTEETTEVSEGDDGITYGVVWRIRFVDKDMHGIVLAEERSGTAISGEELFINFPTTIHDGNGNTWTSMKAPYTHTIYGQGEEIIYIEYEKTKTKEPEEDPYAAQREELGRWLGYIAGEDALLTGEDAESIYKERSICGSMGASDMRLSSLAASITDGDEHAIYVIGKNLKPNGITLKGIYGTDISYGISIVSSIHIGTDIYYVTRFLVTKGFSMENCSHEWLLIGEREVQCLKHGTEKYECELCGETKEAIIPALGHIDEDGDSICDRCLLRTEEQSVGDVIQTQLFIASPNEALYDLDFICVDEDFEGGMLYITGDEITASDFGGFGTRDYAKSNVFRFLSNEFANEFSIEGAALKSFKSGDTNAHAAMLTEPVASGYLDLIGGEYISQTMEAGELVKLVSDGMGGYTKEYVEPDSDFGIRLAIVLEKPDGGKIDPTHYELGDTVAKEIYGRTYFFTCIDQNYTDRQENYESDALFICDSIIPASEGGSYVYMDTGDGHYAYELVPGPIAVYGSSNNYKYSDVRAFLDGETVADAREMLIGVDRSYLGMTKAGKYGSLTGEGLNAYGIGYQEMDARLFIFSVEEALKYREYLWKFGSEEENPQTQISAYCHGYWLRSPAGNAADYGASDQVYIVDLDTGNIHPAKIRPDAGSGDEVTDKTCNIGVRPVMVLAQN